MKTKLEMAHDWMMKHDDGSMSVEVIVFKAWQYADAMQAEAEKREKEQQSEHVFEAIDEWQPDWSQAPSDYDWFVVGGCSGQGLFCAIKPEIVRDHYWFVGEDYFTMDSHGYTGDWRESLRKRPE